MIMIGLMNSRLMVSVPFKVPKASLMLNLNDKFLVEWSFVIMILRDFLFRVRVVSVDTVPSRD